MSNPFEDQKRRPPPIRIPPALPRQPPAAPPPRTSSRQQQHGEARNASSSTQQGPRSVSSPLTSPLEHDGSRIPFPQSGSHKSRASAINALTTLMEESRASSRKSDQGSTTAKSTTRSRHSERSHHSATATAQAQLEVLDQDERTSRAKIEARGEAHLFKVTGQVPPTPMLAATGEDEIIVLRQDLREECRAATAEKKAERQDPIKSPKKKLFGMNLPSFGRSTPAPPMPSKAAQVLGQEPRNPTKVVVRPIKPAGPIKTPTKAPRSDTSKSLPAKLLSQSTYTRSHHSSAARRNRASSRKSPPRGSKQSSDAEDAPLTSNVNASFESTAPPTPPAKDTPPECKATSRAASPLRRAAPGSDRLRENYQADVDNGEMLKFPVFALSPSPTKDHNAENTGKSPTKHLPCTAEEYHKLIAGEPLPWAFSPQSDSSRSRKVSPLRFSPLGGNLAGPLDMPAKRWSEEDYYEQYGEPQDSHSAPLEGENRVSLQLPPQERRSEDYVQSNRDSRHYSPLRPRFYSPSDRSVQLFADGETPSKNSDTSRLLCTVTSRKDLFKFQEDSNNGSIEMLFQGDANEIDHKSSNGELRDGSNEHSMSVQARDDVGLTARVMQELRINEQQDRAPRENGVGGHLQPDQSSSRLTDMLHGVSPLRGDSHGDFRANCPSAVPSPLHKVPGAHVATQPIVPLVGSIGPPRLPFSPKSIDDHFYMTNEHLDVMGKAGWDHTETVRKELLATASHRHAKLLAAIETHVQGIKMQIDSVNEKADRATEQSHNIHTKLEELFDFIKGDVMGALATQDKKMLSLDSDVNELQKTVLAMQKVLEEKPSEPKQYQQHNSATPTPAPLPVHRSQTSLAGYYGNMTETGREGPPAMQQMPDHRNSGLASDTHTDPRTGYGGNYGQQWAPRAGYQGRSSKEERPYSATNPYTFANGAANGGQYSNGYNGYSYN